MTHPTLKDAARALCIAQGYEPSENELARAAEEARAVLLSIRPPDREDLPLRQLEARDYIDGILNG